MFSYKAIVTEMIYYNFFHRPRQITHKSCSNIRSKCYFFDNKKYHLLIFILILNHLVPIITEKYCIEEKKEHILSCFVVLIAIDQIEITFDIIYY